MKINIKRNCFYIALASFGIQYVLGSSNLTNFLGIPISYVCAGLKLGALVLLAVKIIFYTKYTKMQYLFAILFVSLAISTRVITQTDEIFFITFFIIAAKDTSYRTICKTTVYTYVPTIVFIMFLSIVGAIENSVISEGKNILTGESVSRNSFGFEHVNFMGGFILNVFISYMYLKKENYNIKTLAFSILLIIFLLVFVSSKTAALVIAVTTLLLVFENIIKKFNIKLINKVCLIIMIFTVLISFIVPQKFDSKNSLHVKIDKMFSLRISYANSFITNYSPKLLAQQLTFVSSVQALITGEKAMVLDNGFLHLLLRYGILEFIIFMAIYCRIFFKYGKMCPYIAICVAIVFVVAISEKWLFMLGYNTIPLLLYAKND